MDNITGATSLHFNAPLSRSPLSSAEAQAMVSVSELAAIRAGEQPAGKPLSVQPLPQLPQLTVTSVQSLQPLDLPVYEVRPTEEKIRFSNRAEHPLNVQLERGLKGFSDSGQWGRNALGLGALIRSGVDSYQQRAERSIAPAGLDLGALEPGTRRTHGVERQAELTLELTTQGGQRVSFSLALESGSAKLESGEGYRYQEIIVGFEVDGELSEEARKAIDEFSKQLGQFAEQFFQRPDRGPDLGALKLFESDQLAEINLRLNGSDASFELRASEADDERRLDVSWVTNESAWEDQVGRSENKLQLLLRKHGTSEAANIQKDLALTQQQEIIRESLAEAEATDQQKNYIERGFSAIHSGLYLLPPQGESSMLTGLADYQLTFEGEWRQPMRAEHILEDPTTPTALRGNDNSFLFEGLKKFELNQSTRINTVFDKTDITQTQNMKLDAAYFRPLAHLEQVDFKNQNFIYHRIENEHRIVSEQHYDGQELVAASITQERNYSHRVDEYSEGALVSSVPNQRSSFNYVDVTELLQQTLSEEDPQGRGKSRELMDRQARQQYQLLVEELFASKAFDD